MKLTIPDVLDKFKSYYKKPENSTWGSLHIVLDDGNVEDGDVEFCIKYAKKNDDFVGIELGKLLLKMSKTQRLKLGNIIK